MWEWFKSLFRKAKPPAPVVEPEVRIVLVTPNQTFRRGMWAMMGDQIGIIADFKGADVDFHHVDRDTGLTIKEEQISSLRVRQAKYSEIPTCRNGLSVEAAERLGYGP